MKKIFLRVDNPATVTNIRQEDLRLQAVVCKSVDRQLFGLLDGAKSTGNRLNVTFSQCILKIQDGVAKETHKAGDFRVDPVALDGARLSQVFPKTITSEPYIKR